MKRLVLIGIISIIAVVGLGFFSVAQARSVRTNETVLISKDEVVDNLLVAFGTNVNIDGTVNGDVYCGAESVNITGTVNGDVFCTATYLNINGKVTGSVRIAGQDIKLNGEVTRNVMAAGESVIFDQQSLTGQDIIVAGGIIKLYGKVGRDADLHGENVSVGAEIGRDLTGSMQQLYIAPSAKIAGDVSYRSPNELNRSSEAIIGGEIKRATSATNGIDFGANIVASILVIVFILVSLLLVSMVSVLVYPALFVKTNDIIKNKAGQSALGGVVVIFVVPLLMLFLALTFIGLPLTMLILAIWAVVVLLSGPVMAYFVGSLILRNKKSPLGAMALGSVIIIGLYLIPLINVFTMLAVGLFGSGSIAINMLEARKKVK